MPLPDGTILSADTSRWERFLNERVQMVVRAAGDHTLSPEDVVFFFQEYGEIGGAMSSLIPASFCIYNKEEYLSGWLRKSESANVGAVGITAYFISPGILRFYKNSWNYTGGRTLFFLDKNDWVIQQTFVRPRTLTLAGHDKKTGQRNGCFITLYPSDDPVAAIFKIRTQEEV